VRRCVERAQLPPTRCDIDTDPNASRPEACASETLATGFLYRFLFGKAVWKIEKLNGYAARTFTDPEWYLEKRGFIQKLLVFNRCRASTRIASVSFRAAFLAARLTAERAYYRPIPIKNSKGVEKSGDSFRSAVVSRSSRNSSHGSAVGFVVAYNWNSRS
jgi:hypothetical protein